MPRWLVDSPYFGVTDEAGRLTFSAVPPGAYRYHAWRAGSDKVSGTVTIGPNTVEIQWPAG